MLIARIQYVIIWSPGPSKTVNHTRLPYGVHGVATSMDTSYRQSISLLCNLSTSTPLPVYVNPLYTDQDLHHRFRR